MEADIDRWRTIGATKLYSFPNTKTILIGKEKARRKVETQNQPGSNSENSQKSRKSQREPLHQLFDRFLADQRSHVQTYASGHLNAENFNKRIENTKKKRMFGNDESSAKDGGLPSAKMFEMLEEFDSVKITTERDLVSHNITTDSALSLQNSRRKEKKTVSNKPNRKFVTAPHFSLTKFDHYKALTMVDEDLVKNGRKLRHADIGKLDQLKSHQQWIKDELEAANCPPEGPDRKRLQIYSTCFERLIQDFTTHGELLAAIKREYDITISSFNSRDEEFIYLRSKVQKLLSQNENRVMLKFEKQKCREWAEKIALVEAENKRLKEEMVYKVSVYSSFLPKGAAQEAQKTRNDKTTLIEYGKDPLSIRDKMISDRDQTLKERNKEIAGLKKAQDEEFVPKVTKEKLEENLKALEEKFKTCTESNLQLENAIKSKKETIKRLEQELREREQNYQFLVAEYSDLSAGLLKKTKLVLTEPKDEQGE